MLNAQNSSASNNTNAVTDEDNAEDISEDSDLPEESDLNDDSDIFDSDTGNDIVPETPQAVDSGLTVSEDGEYTSKEEVALYIHLYNHLPDNFITKKEAQDLGWDSSKGNLNKVAPGKSIGGDKFGNREGLLPKKEGRVYYECDIDYKKGSRNAKRIVFSNDGLIYYTEDHYESYELLYE
ncbi:MAG: ribonuclease [Lachnospiraceae bacterium]|nr:ribonuclease [Lachnospiraceae bacterium]